MYGCDGLSLPLSTSFVGFPTKLYEYLASGKPVISWNGENIRPLAHLIAPADGVDAWLEALDRALDGRGPGSPEESKAVARAQDWDARTDKFEGWLREMMASDRSPKRRWCCTPRSLPGTRPPGRYSPSPRSRTSKPQRESRNTDCRSRPLRRWRT